MGIPLISALQLQNQGFGDFGSGGFVFNPPAGTSGSSSTGLLTGLATFINTTFPTVFGAISASKGKPILQTPTGFIPAPAPAPSAFPGVKPSGLNRFTQPDNLRTILLVGGVSLLGIALLFSLLGKGR